MSETPALAPSDGVHPPQDPRPILTIDMDGVFCRPLLGWNAGISRTFLDPEAPPEPARISPRWLRGPWDTIRFGPRRPMPEAREAFERLRTVRQLVIVTGRRSHPGWWLRRHELHHLFDRVIVNEGALRSPHYKLATLDLVGATEHIDDDPRTAQLLAQRSRVRVFLRTWPTNRDVVVDESIERVRDLHELADRLGAPPRE